LLSFVIADVPNRVQTHFRCAGNGPRGHGRRSIDRQVHTPHRRCAARDLFSSVDTVVVGRQTTSLPALAVSTGEARSPRPRRASDPFGEYLSKDGEYAHRSPPWTLESLAKYSARCHPRH
jgi:hypothetical protein